MSTSQARIDANRRNSALSTGPRSEIGKRRSRENSLKHGMTGAGVVLPEADAAEVERRALAFAAEANAPGEIGRALARRAALNSVRMERGADQQAAALADRVRRAEADCEVPEGADPEEADRLRAEAGRRAMFDPSREATLARQYEAAAERGFFRALKELGRMARAVAAPSKAEALAEAKAMLGSFAAQKAAAARMDAEFDALYPEFDLPAVGRPAHSPHLPAPQPGGADLPFAIGLRR